MLHRANLSASADEQTRRIAVGLAVSWLAWETRRKEVIVMFKWLQSRRRRPQPDLVAEPPENERDSGEEEHESHEEEEREAAPSGMTRIKTDDI
jgi:hypothetical protein